MTNKINAQVVDLKLEKTLFYAFLALAGVLLVVYLYFINLSVFNIAYSQKAIAQIDDLKTTVASLEAEYLGITQSQITTDYAASLGFLMVTGGQNYAVVDNQRVTLSVVNDEI